MRTVLFRAYSHQVLINVRWGGEGKKESCTTPVEVVGLYIELVSAEEDRLCGS